MSGDKIIVDGSAILPNQPNKNGDIFDEEALLKAVEEYNKNDGKVSIDIEGIDGKPFMPGQYKLVPRYHEDKLISVDLVPNEEQE